MRFFKPNDMKKILMSLIIIWFSFSALTLYADEKMVSVKLRNYIENPNCLQVKMKGHFSTLSPTLTLKEGVNYTLFVENGILFLQEDQKKKTRLSSELFLFPEKLDEEHLIFVNERPYMGALTFTVEDKNIIRPINQLPLEFYLKGVVPNEVFPSWGMEALKAQTLAARTYAYIHSKGAKMMDDTVHFQAYGGYSTYKRTNQAVEETRGEIVTYKGKPISTFYSASNGGMTESNENVWGGTAKKYFPIKEDPFDPQEPWEFKLHQSQISLNQLIDGASYNWLLLKEKDKQITISMRKWLERKGYIDPKIISIDNFQISKEQTESNRSVKGSIAFTFIHRPIGDMIFFDQIELNEVPLSHIRPIIGGNIFKSYLIDSLELMNGVYIIKGRGFGHGVGMSQWGANEMAKKGKNYKQIINYYYPETKITQTP